MTMLYDKAPPPIVRVTMVRDSAKSTAPAVRIGGPKDAASIARSLLEGEAQEVFLVLLLDTKHRVIATHEVSRGSVDGALVHPREVFRAAVMMPCTSIICAHNHPSGDPTPSAEDIAVTRRLEQAGKVLGISLLDHVIVGAGRTWSITEGIETVCSE